MRGKEREGREGGREGGMGFCLNPNRLGKEEGETLCDDVEEGREGGREGEGGMTSASAHNRDGSRAVSAAST